MKGSSSMRHEVAGKRLDDYVDGALAAEETAGIESHLAGCTACRTTVAELEALLAEAGRLPREIRPVRDLWPDISRAIQRGGGRDRSLPRFVARAVAAAAGILIIAWLVKARVLPAPPGIDDPSGAAVPLACEPPDAALLEPLRALEVVCRGAEVELARSGARARPEGRFVPETRIIDSVAVAVHRAWVTDPGSARLFRALARAYRTRVDVRRRQVEQPLKQPF